MEEGSSVAEDGSEEELDAALENVLAASLPTLHNPPPLHSSLTFPSIPFLEAVSLPSDHNTRARASAASTSIPKSSFLISNAPAFPEAMPFGLTFSFPGWGVDICCDSKRRKPSILRHALNPVEENLKRGHKPAPTAWSGGVLLADGCPVFEVPDEVLALLLMRLEIRDLCSVMQTCRRWHCVGSTDFLWRRFAPDKGFNDDATAKLSRRLFVKNYTLSFRVSSRYTYFRKGYDHLRSALNDWWELGRPDGRYGSLMVHSLIRKLTAQDWSLVYEAFGAAFSHRSDCLATMLISALEKVKTDRMILSKCVLNYREHKRNEKVSAKFIDDCKGFRDGSSLNCEPVEINCDSEDLIVEDGPAEKGLWRLLYNLWNRYKCWLTLIFSHCANLNHEVMVERARSAAFSATPTVYDKGVISFRSQVVLRFGLRGALQAGFSWLTTQDHNGSSSDLDVELLRSLHHMLQELDVPDDYTLCENTYTQIKLRRCFIIPRLFNHKLIQPCPKINNFTARPNLLY